MAFGGRYVQDAQPELNPQMEEPTRKLDPYTLVSKIGRGAFGVVWLAEKKSFHCNAIWARLDACSCFRWAYITDLSVRHSDSDNTESLIWPAGHAQRRIDSTIKGTRLNRMISILKMLMPA